MSHPISLLGGNTSLTHKNGAVLEASKKIAKFVIDNPRSLNIIHDVIKACFESSLFPSKIDEIITLEKIAPDGYEKIDEIEALLREFYQSSTDIPDDRGFLVEKICEMAFLEKIHINSGDNHEFKVHSKVCIDWDKCVFSTDPHDIDVCSKRDIEGDYVECKRGIDTFLDEQAQRKVEKLTQLKKNFTDINDEHSMNHTVQLFMFTRERKKLSHYMQEWPEMNVLGIEQFMSKYLS